MSKSDISARALAAIYAPWDMPDKHRVKGGDVVEGRRTSPITVVNSLRAAVRDWREGAGGVGEYAGASKTSAALLQHWFGSEHLRIDAEGYPTPFSYYFCQREAIETLIYLLEVRRIRRTASLLAQFCGLEGETAALGLDPEWDTWPRFAFKMATGSGKTKVMSLAITWSYFHSQREPFSEMVQNFVIIAPNIIVFERLREDFKPANGGPSIFDTDPLVPTEWRNDFNVEVVLQNEPCPIAVGGTLFLTNVHRLYDHNDQQKKRDTKTYDFAGPSVPNKPFANENKDLISRISSRGPVLVMNDEAHHVWDPGSAWNDAILSVQRKIQRHSTIDGIVTQLDFSATPKDNRGQVFRQVVCDFPLSEAVDSGIVKTPVIGRADNLTTQPSDDAAITFQRHLLLGYSRWKDSWEEWKRSGKKALMFVMTEDTQAADQIARELNSNPLFRELNGRAINLHTKLKGKLKKVGSGRSIRYEFVENDKDISEEDIRQLRNLTRELDLDPHHYCIVSVLMLREGWDVRNVTTIVPLRPFTSKSAILPEQTLGRGLRRMTAAGTVDEILTVVEHKSFATLYQHELSQQGFEIEVIDVERVPKTSVTIYPDSTKSDFDNLQITIPSIGHEYSTSQSLHDLSFEDIRGRFDKLNLSPLSLGKESIVEIDYTGRTLLTDEIVHQMTILIPLLQNGFGAVSFYREQLERICGIKGMHPILAPLIQSFFEELVFGAKQNLTDPRVVARLGDADVAEFLRAIFVPLIRERIIMKTTRKREESNVQLSAWKPFQATHSESRPAIPSRRTLFNLVPCNRNLEVAFSEFISIAEDVKSFAKNAGPQALRIDYLASGSRLAFYTPDFFVVTESGYFLVETKGREDKDVAGKARAAAAWCKAASNKHCKWKYVYITQGAFNSLSSNQFSDLVSLSQPSLAELISESPSAQLDLFVSGREDVSHEEFIDQWRYDELPERYKSNIDQAILLFRFIDGKKNLPFTPAFTPLLGPLEDGSAALLAAKLGPLVPRDRVSQHEFFEPDLTGLEKNRLRYYQNEVKKLERTLVFRAPISPIGHLKFALDMPLSSITIQAPIFSALTTAFPVQEYETIRRLLPKVYEFRNKYIAHQESTSLERQQAHEQLHMWCELLWALHGATSASVNFSTSRQHE